MHIVANYATKKKVFSRCFAASLAQNAANPRQSGLLQSERCDDIATSR